MSDAGDGIQSPTNLTNLNGSLIYLAHKRGTGSTGSNPASFKLVGTKAYFQADDGVNGAEFWCTDGTEAGTVLAKDIYIGASGSYPDNLAVIDNDLYFPANDGTNGRELWKANGCDSPQACKSVEFNPGFEVKAGAVFKAQIAGCDL